MEISLLSSSTPAARLVAFTDLALEFLARETPGKDLTRAQVSAYIGEVLAGRSATRYIVAFGTDGKALGAAVFALLSSFSRDWVFLQEIFTSKAARGKGLELALANAVIDWGKEHGACSLASSIDAGSAAHQAFGDELGLGRVEAVWREKDL